MVWTPQNLFVCVFFLWGPFPGHESGCIDSGEGIVEFHKKIQHRTISAALVPQTCRCCMVLCVIYIHAK